MIKQMIPLCLAGPDTAKAKATDRNEVRSWFIQAVKISSWNVLKSSSSCNRARRNGKSLYGSGPVSRDINPLNCYSERIFVRGIRPDSRRVLCDGSDCADVRLARLSSKLEYVVFRNV